MSFPVEVSWPAAFRTLPEILVLCVVDYNEQAPHKALKMKSPREYRRLAAKLETCPEK